MIRSGSDHSIPAGAPNTKLLHLAFRQLWAWCLTTTGSENRPVGVPDEEIMLSRRFMKFSFWPLRHTNANQLIMTRNFT